MRIISIFGILSILALSFLLISCNSVPDELQCTQDSDCTAAVCCHADQAINVAYAPDCTTTLCSADCQEGTMDCGQATAQCVQGACTVVAVE